MAKNLKNYQRGGFNLNSVYQLILNFLRFTPIINAVFYFLFIIFSFVVIIELIWKKNASDIKWYSGYTHFFIKLLIAILIIPLFPLLVNIVIDIVTSFSGRKKRPVGAHVPPHDGTEMASVSGQPASGRWMNAFGIDPTNNMTTYHGGIGNSREEYMNYGFFEIVIKGLKFVLLESFHTFMTFFLVISYFSLVEHTEYFKNFLNIVNFIIFTLLLFYAITIFFKIYNAKKQENILAYLILLVLLNFIFSPLFFILTKTVELAKNSDNFIVNLVILILFALVGLGINKLRWQLNSSIQRLQKDISDFSKNIKNWSESDKAKGFDEILNKLVNLF